MSASISLHYFPLRSTVRYLLALLFIAASLPGLRAGPWEDANAAFAAGDYRKAAPLYEEIISREGSTASRLFNLGNTYAKLNQPGEAVLQYERAALLAPRDADIRANLKLTRPANAANLQRPPPWWTAPLYWLSLNEWSWVTAAGLVLIAVPLLMKQILSPGVHRIHSPKAESTARSGAAALQIALAPLVGCGSLLALLGGLALQQRHEEKNLAILTAAGPVLRLSPFPAADPVDASPPLPGQRVIPGERSGNWVHLTIPGSSTTGWLPDNDLALIIPADS